jgi:predicted SnoaL-like aldol condensation-catalyzing enzyme
MLAFVSSLREARVRSKDEEAALQLVLEMFHTVLVPLDADRVDDYISPDYIQHSQMAAPGVDSLKAFLREKRIENPDARQHLKRAFVDDDHVILHYHVQRSADDIGFGVIDIFRIANGRIVEHWDCVQPVPEHPVNPNSMF